MNPAIQKPFIQFSLPVQIYCPREPGGVLCEVAPDDEARVGGDVGDVVCAQEVGGQGVVLAETETVCVEEGGEEGFVLQDC